MAKALKAVLALALLSFASCSTGFYLSEVDQLFPSRPLDLGWVCRLWGEGSEFQKFGARGFLLSLFLLLVLGIAALAKKIITNFRSRAA